MKKTTFGNVNQGQKFTTTNDPKLVSQFTFIKTSDTESGWSTHEPLSAGMKRTYVYFSDGEEVFVD